MADIAGATIGTVLRLAYTAPLKPPSLVMLLAGCAEHVCGLGECTKTKR